MHRRHFITHLAKTLPITPLIAPALLASTSRPLATPEPTCPWHPLDPNFEALAEWEGQPRTLITESSDPLARRILTAARSGSPLTITYRGEPRTITPLHLFEVDDFPATYCTAYCHLRQAGRTFRLDRMEVNS